MMKQISKIAIVALALSLGTWPLTACMLLGSAITAQERECCMKMADPCGGPMAMPLSHSCCKLTVHQSDSYLINPRFTSNHPYSLATLLVGGGVSAVTVRSVAGAHSPPISPPATTISVLRI
jgi:hypothetical protein